MASYELFDLRDDVTGSANIFDQFGIMTDGYVPKPMFWTYRHLVATLGGRQGCIDPEIGPTGTC